MATRALPSVAPVSQAEQDWDTGSRRGTSSVILALHADARAVAMMIDTPDDQERASAWHWRVARCIVGWIGLIVIGATVGRLLPPFSIDWPWVGTFVTSPGLGGLAAVCAAIIALAAALYTSRRSATVAAKDRAQRDRLAGEDRHQREIADQRAQWWTRFTWAADRAVQAETSELVGDGQPATRWCGRAPAAGDRHAALRAAAPRELLPGHAFRCSRRGCPARYRDVSLADRLSDASEATSSWPRCDPRGSRQAGRR